jgi:hypothetical protein
MVIQIRRFTVLDGMIVVGAVGLALAPLKWLGLRSNSWVFFREMAAGFAWDWGWFDDFIPEMLLLATPPAVAATLAVLAMRLRQPRPLWRKLTRQPGLAACLVLVPTWALAAAFTVVNVLSIDRMTPPFKDGSTYAQQAGVWGEGFATWGGLLGGFAVLIAWATLAISGRWRAEPSWLDRLGRLVGLAWIALALMVCYALRTTNG